MKDPVIAELENKIAERKKQNRSHKIFLTVTPHEYKLLLSAALATDMNVNEYIRAAIKDSIEKKGIKQPAPQPDFEIMKDGKIDMEAINKFWDEDDQ